jgi:hypothetical protein
MKQHGGDYIVPIGNLSILGEQERFAGKRKF